jgi:misacylated tRNA(Ala) deacylase
MQERLHLNHHPGTNPPDFSTRITDKIDESIILESSYFYPRGGGQPGDIGTLSEGNVSVDVGEVFAKDVIHHPVSNIEMFEVDSIIQCSIDSEYRNQLAHMHTTQHIVSAMADELWGASTVGNQLGTKESRIDLLFEDKTQFNMDQIQDTVNEILRKEIPVFTHNWTADEIMSDDRVRNRSFVGKILERLPEDITTMRVVDIQGIDICPCAGTHVANISELSEIEIVRIKQKGSGKIRLYTQLKNDNE